MGTIFVEEEPTKNRRRKTPAMKTASGGRRRKLRRKNRRRNIDGGRMTAEDRRRNFVADRGEIDCGWKAEIVGKASMPKVGVGSPKKLRNTTWEFRTTTVLTLLGNA